MPKGYGTGSYMDIDYMPTPPKTPQKRGRSASQGNNSLVDDLVKKAQKYVAKQLSKKAKTWIETKTKTKKASGSGSKFVSNGYFGKSKKPKYRRKAYKKVGRNMSKGCIKKTEGGGTLSDADAVYVGHSFASNEILELLCLQVIKDLFHLAGDRFESFDIPIAISTTADLKVGFNYYLNESDTSIIGFQVDVTTSTTYKQLAGALKDQIIAAFSVGDDDHIPVDFNLVQAVTPVRKIASISCKDYYLTYNIYSKLTIQNRTLAGNGDTEATDITNNPLVGRIYEKSGNGFTPLWRSTNDASYQTMVANQDTGMIKMQAAASIPEVLKEMPEAQMFGVKKTASITLTPGEMKSNTLVFTRRIGCVYLFELFNSHFCEATDENLVKNFGKVAIIGLEKMLDDRSETDNTVNVSYELNQVYRITSYRQYRQKTVSFYQDKGSI